VIRGGVVYQNLAEEIEERIGFSQQDFHTPVAKCLEDSTDATPEKKCVVKDWVQVEKPVEVCCD
jgi:hypothetical protein